MGASVRRSFPGCPSGAGGRGPCFPGKGQRMRINRQGGELKRQALVAVERAQLAVVKGGLKADRVQGTDPANPGGN